MVQTLDSKSEAHAKLTEAMMRFGDRLSSAELVHCVPRLLDLLNESHHRPIDELAPGVRLVIVEHCDCDEGGDASVHHAAELEVLVRQVIAELDRVRLTYLQRGHWSDVPVPPQMFG